MSRVHLIGVPFTVGCRPETSAAMDQQNAPLAIRAAIRTLTANYNIPLGFRDLGDIEAERNIDSVLSAVEEEVALPAAEEGYVEVAGPIGLDRVGLFAAPLS